MSSNGTGQFQFSAHQRESLKHGFAKRRATLVQQLAASDEKFAADYASLGARRQNADVVSDESVQPEVKAALSDVKIEASGVLNLHHVFDIANIYKALHRPKRSETELNIMSCQFSPSKDLLAVALSTGEIEVLRYEESEGDLALCYTLMDRDVNGPTINCTSLAWLPDNRKLLASYTNGFLKLWHVTSKNALLSRNENKVSQPLEAFSKYDLVSEVFEKSNSARRRRSSNYAQRQVLCVAYSRQTLVDLEEHVKPILYPDSGGKKASVEARSPKKLPGESKKTENKSHADLLLSEMQSKKSLDAPIESDEEDYSYQVVIVATGGSDGNIVLWFLTDPSFLKEVPAAVFTPEATLRACTRGRQLLFHRCCAHGGNTKAMDGHMMKIFAVRFLPQQPTHLLSGGWDGQIFRWDALTGNCLLSCKGPVMCSNESIDLDQDIERPLVLCADHNCGFLDIINYKHGEELVVDTRIFLPTDRFLMPYAAAFLGVDKILVGGSNPNSLRIIDRKVNLNEDEKGATTPGGHVIPEVTAKEARVQGEAIIYGSTDDLPAAVSCIALGREDKLKRQQVVACCGSLLVVLSTTVRH